MPLNVTHWAFKMSMFYLCIRALKEVLRFAMSDFYPHNYAEKLFFWLQIHQHSVMEGKIISSVTPPNCSLFQEAAMGNRGRERLTLGCNRMEKDDRSSHSHFDTLYIAWPWFQRHIVHRDQFAHTVDIRWDHRGVGMTIDILTHDPFSHEKGFIH